MKRPDGEDVNLLRLDYKQGMRVCLLQSDYKELPPSGTVGIVQEVNDFGALVVKWNDGSTHSILPWVDRFEIRPFVVVEPSGVSYWTNVYEARDKYVQLRKYASDDQRELFDRILVDLSENKDICTCCKAA